jgi:hypothetical protein
MSYVAGDRVSMVYISSDTWEFLVGIIGFEAMGMILDGERNGISHGIYQNLSLVEGDYWSVVARKISIYFSNPVSRILLCFKSIYILFWS